MRRALAILDPTDRQILLLTLVEGLKPGEIGARLGMTGGGRSSAEVARPEKNDRAREKAVTNMSADTTSSSKTRYGLRQGGTGGGRRELPGGQVERGGPRLRSRSTISDARAASMSCRRSRPFVTELSARWRSVRAQHGTPPSRMGARARPGRRPSSWQQARCCGCVRRRRPGPTRIGPTPAAIAAQTNVGAAGALRHRSRRCAEAIARATRASRTAPIPATEAARRCLTKRRRASCAAWSTTARLTTVRRSRICARAAALDPDAAHIRFFLGITISWLGRTTPQSIGFGQRLRLAIPPISKKRIWYLAKALSAAERLWRRRGRVEGHSSSFTGPASDEAGRLLTQVERLKERRSDTFDALAHRAGGAAMTVALGSSSW